MSKNKLSLGSLIGGFALILVGILTITNQNAFVKIIVICSGIAALVDGLYTLIVLQRWNFTEITRRLTLIKGILMSVSGVIGIVMPLVAAKTVVAVVVYVFGAMLVYSAFVSIHDAIVVKTIDSAIPRGHFYIEAIASLIIAIIFFSDPSKVLSAFVVIVGIASIVAGLAFIVIALIRQKNDF